MFQMLHDEACGHIVPPEAPVLVLLHGFNPLWVAQGPDLHAHLRAIFPTQEAF